MTDSVNDSSSDIDSISLYEKLLTETARVSWPEIERLFAAGRVVRVGADMNLVEVGEVFASDNTDQLRQWMQSESTGLLDDETAGRWSRDEHVELWAVVVRPWVLVQERAAQAG